MSASSSSHSQVAGPSYSRQAANNQRPKQESKVDDYYSELYPTSTYAPAISWSVNNKIMRQCAAGVCYISSFDTATQTALEMVTHLMSSYIISICNQSKTNCEIAGRTIPIASDIWLGLINLGMDVEALPEYMNTIYNGGHLVVLPPKVNVPHTPTSPLRIGKSRPHPAYVNDFFPPFPDPHTYIRTEISGEPDMSYERVRELAANKKRDIECSLVDLMLRMHPRTCLFKDYEAKVKEEANVALKAGENEKSALRQAVIHARAIEEMDEVRLSASDELMETDFLEPSRPYEKEKESNSQILDDELEFNLAETETSLTLKKIPAWCNVLDPSLESRPYLSALVSDEVVDDENNETTFGSSIQANKDGDEQIYDNAFLRPPRMPAKGNFVQF